jgi:1,2-diacylglycerol 3-beta-galactosyltransferase
VTGALREIEPRVRVESSDPLICEGPPVVRRLASLYPKIIQRSGPAWGAIYHGSNTRAAFRLLRGVFGGQVRAVIAGQLKAHDPDVVISVHPLLNHVALAAIRRSGRPRGLMTVVTDLIDLHRGWALPEADLVVVPTEQAGEVVRGLGVPPERVLPLGLPVDLRFRPPAPGERQALRRRFGLEEGRPTLLVLSGGDGSGKLLQQVRALAWGEHEWQVIAVCGRNEKLRRRLSRVRFSTPTVVLGFVDSMPALMRAADLVVTKAGPGAISEALTTGVPLVLTGYLPGQETANVRFVTGAGFGVWAPRPDQLRDAVTRLLSDGGKEAGAMAARAAAIARPYASLDIARECMEVARRYAVGAVGAVGGVAGSEAEKPNPAGAVPESVPVGAARPEAKKVAAKRKVDTPAPNGTGVTGAPDGGDGKRRSRLGWVRPRRRRPAAEQPPYSAASQTRR